MSQCLLSSVLERYWQNPKRSQDVLFCKCKTFCVQPSHFEVQRAININSGIFSVQVQTFLYTAFTLCKCKDSDIFSVIELHLHHTDNVRVCFMDLYNNRLSLSRSTSNMHWTDDCSSWRVSLWYDTANRSCCLCIAYKQTWTE